jgi:hypothetical protein
MGDIIKFPGWLAEKERELDELAINLEFEKHVIDQEAKRINEAKMMHGTRMMVAFCTGMIIAALLLIPIMS